MEEPDRCLAGSTWSVFFLHPLPPPPSISFSFTFCRRSDKSRHAGVPGRRRSQAVSSLFQFGSRTAAVNEFGKPLNIQFNESELSKEDAAQRFKQ